MQFLHDPTHLPACEASLGYRDLAAVYQEFAGKKGHWETQADLRVRACACVQRKCEDTDTQPTAPIFPMRIRPVKIDTHTKSHTREINSAYVNGSFTLRNITRQHDYPHV